MKAIRVLVAVALFALAGCGPRGPKTYPVNGKVTLPGATEKLAGHHVEAALENDPAVRAYGVIQPDGSFALETQHGSQILPGAREGHYRVRIVPAEDDENGNKLRKPPVAAKHLKFETSGLFFQVPASGDVNLKLSSR